MDEGKRQQIERILDGAAGAGRNRLLESEIYEILAAAGVPVPRYESVPLEEAEERLAQAIGRLLAGGGAAGLVAKIQSPEILHKTEAGGIAFTAGDPVEALSACREMVARVRKRVPDALLAGILLVERVSYQPHLPGREMLLTLRQDEAFGPLVVIGLGGVLTEWYGSLAPGATTWIASARDPLFDEAAVPDLAALGPAFRLLFAPSRLHDRAPVDPESFWPILRAWAGLAREFAADAPGRRHVLEEIEVNPLAALPGGGVVALDGIGRFSTTRPRIRRRRIEKIHNLLYPRSVAVVGASGKAMNPGRVILRNLRAARGVDYGKIFPVHPKEEAIDSIPCFASIAELPERVDLAVIAVPAEGARDAIREFVDREKAHSMILIPGGFAETGRGKLEEEIIEALESSRGRPDGGPLLVGGNCLGIVSKRRYNTFFLPQYKLPFHDAPGDNLAAISQSGAYLVTLASNLDGVVFPKASISFGNQMDLTVSDFLEHYLEDPDVRVLACYVEGFKPLDGLRFVDLARAHRARGRTVIAFKAGKTPLGARAAASHTASLAGDYAAARALMERSGVIVAETLNQFEDFTKLFTMLYDRVPKGRRVAMITNAGFECSTAMDRLHGLELAALSPRTKERLVECLPDIAHRDNPVDMTPMATTKQFIQAVEALVADEGVDAVVVSPVPPTPALDNLPPDLAGRHAENIYARGSVPSELVRLFGECGKPIVCSIDSGRLYDESVLLIQRGGIPTFRKIDRATRALGRYCGARAQGSGSLGS